MNDTNIHWYLCMVDLKAKRVMIIDSQLNGSNKRQNDVKSMVRIAVNVNQIK